MIWIYAVQFNWINLRQNTVKSVHNKSFAISPINTCWTRTMHIVEIMELLMVKQIPFSEINVNVMFCYGQIAEYYFSLES